MKPYNVVRDFESALCEYTGAPYAVTTNSCTMALLLACAYEFKTLPTPLNLSRPNRAKNFGDGWTQVMQPIIEIPAKTYASVPMSIVHAGGWPEFHDYEWRGQYMLKPLPVIDAARRFTSGMYHRGFYQCVSFHASKILGDTQGGAILHDDPDADKWFRKARFDGRTEGVHPADDTFDVLGYHCYLSPDVAARLLLKLSVLPRHNEDLPNDQYPDLSKMECFK